jgi:7-cyano-7-deazaguanine synthase
MSKKAIIALSGGMDSATVLTWLLDHGIEVIPVWFDYGSKHNQYEHEAANAIVGHYNLPWPLMIDLTQVMSTFKSNLLKSGGEIPEGHYNDESMSLTVVPARNIIFCSIMAGLAESHGASMIALGVHQGDHAIYPDCRLSFIKAMRDAIVAGTDNKVTIITPFLDTDKTGILEYGLSYGTPYHLTRTCYKDQEASCGRCGSCVERLEAFEELEATDTIDYAK